MTQPDSLRSLFERKARPGALIFALLFLALSIFLLSQLGTESKWIKGTKIFAQPMFWPAVSLIGMTLFATAHLVSVLKLGNSGRQLTETGFWIRSIEYALWFMAYVWLVPVIGYLPATLLFTISLTLRVGYHQKKMGLIAAAMAFVIVVTFKGFLSVRIPGGEIYEHLPDGIRNFMILYL